MPANLRFCSTLPGDLAKAVHPYPGCRCDSDHPTRSRSRSVRRTRLQPAGAVRPPSAVGIIVRRDQRLALSLRDLGHAAIEGGRGGGFFEATLNLNQSGQGCARHKQGKGYEEAQEKESSRLHCSIPFGYWGRMVQDSKQARLSTSSNTAAKPGAAAAMMLSSLPSCL
jgi:hypothetical protein